MHGGTLGRMAGLVMGLLVAAVAGCALAGGALAAAPGSETVGRSGTLETGGQSMWQAGSGGGPEEASTTFFDKRFEASGSGGSIADVKSPTFKVCNIFKGKTVEKFFTEGSTSLKFRRYPVVAVSA